MKRYSWWRWKPILGLSNWHRCEGCKSMFTRLIFETENVNIKSARKLLLKSAPFHTDFRLFFRCRAWIFSLPILDVFFWEADPLQNNLCQKIRRHVHWHVDSPLKSIRCGLQADFDVALHVDSLQLCEHNLISAWKNSEEIASIIHAFPGRFYVRFLKCSSGLVLFQWGKFVSQLSDTESAFFPGRV